MPDNILTVSELTKSIKRLLESNFPKLWVEGEISNYTLHSSGHRYFTLKDDNAQIKCVIWRGMSRYLFFEPENGMKVIASGELTVYERSGQYQLIVSSLKPSGIGALELAFQQLKAKLAKEGLFDERLKKPLPQYPESIGVVTSATGAAVRDIIKVIRRRAPWVEIILRPVLVQGEAAAADIAKAIKEFNEFGRVDILIVGRGGGSLEDLWPFNEEQTARSIAGSKIPVISAVGHQVDFTIADFVADLRAPTPSAAAELAVPDSSELRAYFSESFRRLWQAESGIIESYKTYLGSLTARYGLRKPMEIINTRFQYLDGLYKNFEKTARHLIKNRRNDLSLLKAKLKAASPEEIMSRGYAYVSSPTTKKAIKSFTQVAVSDIIDVRLFKGKLQASVTKVRAK